MNAPSLFDPPVEPTQGRARQGDPQTSRLAASKARVGYQRAHIARLLARYPYVTADDVWTADLRDCRPDRGTYSTRLGGLVHDGLLVKGGPVQRADQHGHRRSVVTYQLTDEGRAWVRRVTAERGAA